MTADKDKQEEKTDTPQEATTGDGGNSNHGQKTENAAPPSKEGRDEEEEDIPPDFFDDFSNQDFMEGLDVVDTWDDDMQEEGEVKDAEDESAEGLETDVKKEGDSEKEETKNNRSTGRHARITFSKEREQKTSRPTPTSRFKDLRERIGRADERRDPEKTRRDILRDKERCAKDKEVKIINEKLKVVETGLVPPGMEMEVDLSEIRSKQDSLKTAAARFNTSSIPGLYIPSKPDYGTSKPKYRTRSRSRSYERFRFRDRPLRSRSRSRSKERRRPPSPYSRKRFRSRSRSRSPYYRDRNLSRDRNKLSGERKSSKPRRRTRERGSRSKSPSSDRERWLVRRCKRSTSVSSLRKRSDGSRLSAKEEKQTFLEEIHRKLNETTHHPARAEHPMQMRTTYAPFMQLPQPVPPILPNPYAPQIPPVQAVPQYDQQFFIGTCIRPAPVPPPCPVPPPDLAGNYGLASLVDENSLLPTPNVRVKKDAPEEPDKTALAKLLEDKKITLSDFLTITAKPSDSGPVNLQQKISVIARCQDAIKELGGDSKLTGRLFIKTYDRPETPERMHASPLRKIPIVRLNFTSSAKTPEEEPTFSAKVTKLLKVLGLFKEPETAPKQEVVDQQQEQQEKAQMKRPKKKERKNNVTIVPQASSVPMEGIKFLMKMCQTDPFKCEVCEERAKRKFEDQEVQCEAKTVADASTQTVTEEPSPLKNKSLSQMTPAEILAEVNKKKKEEETEVKQKIEIKEELPESAVMEDDVLDSGSSLKTTERSVELDHGDKDVAERNTSVETKEPWKNQNKNSWRGKRPVNVRGGYSSHPRGTRVHPNFRGGFDRRAYDGDDADIYGPNFDVEDFLAYNGTYNFDDHFGGNGGPPRRPFFNPPEHVRRKFNRRFF